MTLPYHEIVLGPGEGRSMALANHHITFKAVGADTHGHVGIFEFENAAGSVGAGRHIHRGMDEMFYVLEGKVDISVGDRLVHGEPGAFVLVPRGTPHGFSNPGTTPARVLIIFCPGGTREGFFIEMSEMLKNGPPTDRQALIDLMARYDQEMVD